MISYLDKLSAKLYEGKVVPVVGAGVSYACAGLPSWAGLISSGLEYAQVLKIDERLLEFGRDLLKNGQLIEAASVVKQLLNAPGRPYVNWLEDTLGRPQIKSELLIESIQNLCQPIIATTNYDDLLRNVGVIESNLALDWQQHEEIQRCIDNAKPFILHLHGIYYRPDTTIFGVEDYERLKNVYGYKYLLQDLWMRRTFLFIGCSRDGVMDEDFSTMLKLMKEWFPNIHGEHYLLVKDGEQGSEAHLELMRECNVHMVPYGPDHESLPHFLNGINPNAEKIAKRLEERQAKALKGLTQILTAQHETELQSNVEAFVRGHLGAAHHWLDNDQLKIFNTALETYNRAIGDKQQKFRNQQVIARAMVNVAQLDRSINLWHQDWNSSAQVNNLEFINTGIFAYEALKLFSPEILKDISLRHPTAIRPIFFTGQLANFYNEAKVWKLRGGKLAEFNGDNYFFENLRRIMDSLKAVLSLSPSDVYGEKKAAQIAKKLPKELLLIVADSFISINQASSPFKVLAELPWRERLNCEDAQLVTYKDERLVVGCNANNCFYWNPCKDLDALDFYTAEKNERIWKIEVAEDGDDVILQLYTSFHRLTVANFSEVIKSKIQSGYNDYTRIVKTGKTYCAVSSSPGLKPDCVFEYQSGEYVPLLSRESIALFLDGLWNSDKTEDGLEDAHFNDFRFGFQDVTLSAVKWLDGERLVVRCRIGHRIGAYSTALLFFDPLSGFEIPLLKMYFPHKNCFSFDTGSSNGQVNLIAGYLDFNEVGNLIQLFEDIGSSDLIVAKDQRGLVPQELIRTSIRDMFETIYMSETRGLVLEEGRKVHEISLPSLTDIETTFDKSIHKIYFFK